MIEIRDITQGEVMRTIPEGKMITARPSQIRAEQRLRNYRRRADHRAKYAKYLSEIAKLEKLQEHIFFPITWKLTVSHMGYRLCEDKTGVKTIESEFFPALNRRKNRGMGAKYWEMRRRTVMSSPCPSFYDAAFLCGGHYG